jgi:quinol monooxygenase YgiN
MYARVTRFQVQPDKLDEAHAIGREVHPDILRIPGLRAFASFSRDDGKGVFVAVYENKIAAGAAADFVATVWARFSAILAGPPVMEEYANVLACDILPKRAS